MAMRAKRKGRSGSISGDPREDAALWELAEVLAEIASSGGHSARPAEKSPLKDSTDGTDEPIANV